MKPIAISFLAAGFAAIALAMPAQAAITVVNTPAATEGSCGSITFTGITELACAGGWSDNLIKGSLQEPAVTGLANLGGFTGSSAYIEKITTGAGIVQGSHVINFSHLLTGISYVAIHYGNGSGIGNATSVFKFDAGAGVDSFTISINGLSNAAIMQLGTAPAVPEPATWAMMVAGIGLVGASMRRRKAAVSFA
jgi:hypothetical protein